MKWLKYLVVVYLFGVLSACSPNISPSTATISQPTEIPAQSQKAVPTSSLEPTSTTAPTMAPAVTPLPIVTSDLSGISIHTLCLEIKDNYITGSEVFHQDIFGDLVRLFDMAGIQVVQSGQVCDAHMHIDLTGRAISAKYGSNRWCYTGSSVEGRVQLTLADGRQTQVPFKSGISSPFAITSCPEKANLAPIGLGTSKGLLDAFRQIWSSDFLAIPIYRGTNFDFYSNMAAEVCLGDTFSKKEQMLPCLIAIAVVPNNRQSQALADLQFLAEKARPAVPDLIALLETGLIATPAPGTSTFKNSMDLQSEVVKTLKSISGQDFNLDAAKWWDWWKSDKATISSISCKPGGSYIDAAGDVNIGYLDILKVDTNLENGLLKIVFYQKDLPASFTINNRGKGMSEGSVEYYWGVDIDVDNDDSTGGNGSWGIPEKGVDYSMELFHYIHGNENYGKMDRFLAKINKNEDGSIPKNADLSIDYEARTITFSGLIPGINENSELFFLAFQNLPNYERFDDFLCK